MSIRTLLVSIGLLVACGFAMSQPLPKPATPPPPPPPLDIPQRPDYPPPPRPPVLAQKSVEELLTELERMQVQKTELERKEKELKAAISKKLEEQAERLKKLGIAPPPAKEPDRVGRIIIELCPAKDEKKVRKAIGLAPGQVLTYPAIEKARARLENLGFPEAKIEVIPGERDSSFKDIRVVVRTLGGF